MQANMLNENNMDESDPNGKSGSEMAYSSGSLSENWIASPKLWPIGNAVP